MLLWQRWNSGVSLGDCSPDKCLQTFVQPESMSSRRPVPAFVEVFLLRLTRPRIRLYSRRLLPCQAVTILFDRERAPLLSGRDALLALEQYQSAVGCDPRGQTFALIVRGLPAGDAAAAQVERHFLVRIGPADHAVLIALREHAVVQRRIGRRELFVAGVGSLEQ